MLESKLLSNLLKFNQMLLFQKSKEHPKTEIYTALDPYKTEEYQQKITDTDDTLKVEEYNTSQSPKYHDEYHLMGNNIPHEEFPMDYEEEYQDTDQNIKIPAFLGRGSLDPKEKNQFYMTQIINQSRLNQQYSSGNSQAATKQANSLLNSNLKLPKKQLKSSIQKRGSAVNKSQIIKNLQNKQISPISNKHHQQMDKNMLKLNDFGQGLRPFSINNNNDSKLKKRSNLNTSALLTTTKDFLNSTAPINMNQLNKIHKEEVFVSGFSDAVNSTQNLRRINSKESCQKDQQNYSSYYSGVAGPKQQKTGTITKQSMSPNKVAKKQLLIQSILNQDKNKSQNNKYFLNLTLQQLIQQQHQENYPDQQVKFNYIQKPQQDTRNQQKRLNKTLDNFKEQYINTYMNYQADAKIRQQMGNNSQSGNSSSIPKHKQKLIQQKNKFSNTMKFSDFNQTQVFDVKFSNHQAIDTNSRKSKLSLKSTQNLNLQEENHQARKASALSTYSMNTAQTTTTHNNMNNKHKKIVNAKQGQQVAKETYDSNKQTLKPNKRQDSQDKDLIKKILNFYQDDFLQQYNINEVKPKTQLSGSKNHKPQVYTKHKAHSTLNQYLQNKMNIYNDLNIPQNKEITPAPQIQTASNPYKNPIKKTPSNTKKDNIKEIQNKTQPIPKTLLEMAQTQAINLSTGTSIICNKIPSKDSLGKQSRGNSKSKGRINKTEDKRTNVDDKKQVQQKPKIGKRKDVEIARQKDEDPDEIYNNKNTVILDEIFRQENTIEDQEQSEPNTSRLDRYMLGKQIGQGAYAVVRVAVNKKDNKKYAIKIYDKSKLTDTNRQRSVRREIKLLQKMNHPNIVKIFEAFETEHHVYLVMEYVAGGSLHSYLKEKSSRRLDEEDAKRIFKQIMTALQYCHRKCIAHRDIKLENILLDENKNVKLIDFGFSTCIPNDKKIKMFCGTPSYMAPEIVMKEEYAGPPADIWASAVLLYALMNGCFPFRGATDKELYRRIQRGTFVLQNENASDQFVEILTKMINVNADKRPSAEEILNDEWFTKAYTKVYQQENGEKIQINGSNDQSIADQKRLFKAKILGKIPVEKQKNTICINSSQEQMKNLQFARNGNSNGNPIMNNTFQMNQNQNNCANNNNDFSDYGLQQQNVMRKLNQEAYQAYYNTSGGNFGMNNNTTSQNPYYNNFFQNNFMGIQNPNTIGFYQPFNPGQMRNSPSKQNTNTHFPINFNQNQQNQIGTPQVFGSPTAGFHCNGGMINNNFNIINNITQVTCLSPPSEIISPTSQPQQSQPQSQQQQTATNYDQQQMKKDNTTEFDEEIVGSIIKQGYHKSHVVSQLEDDNSQISQIYARLKEEKMSQTQNRPLSLQPGRRTNQTGKGYHNNAIFPAFVPSIPDSIKALGDDKEIRIQNYYDQNDYTDQSPQQRDTISL